MEAFPKVWSVTQDNFRKHLVMVCLGCVFIVMHILKAIAGISNLQFHGYYCKGQIVVKNKEGWFKERH